MKNILDNPFMLIVGSILFLIGGVLMICHAPELLIFSYLFSLAGKLIASAGGIGIILGVFLWFI